MLSRMSRQDVHICEMHYKNPMLGVGAKLGWPRFET